MRWLPVSILLLSLFANPALRAQAVFQEDFQSTPNPLITWENGGDGIARVESIDARNALSVRIAGPASGNHLVTHGLPLERIRGTRVSVKAMVKADNVAKPPKVWNGIKLMLYTNSPTLGEQYEAVSQLHGTFDWRELGFSASVPVDVTEAKLYLGLEATTGAVWFDDVALSIGAIPRVRPAVKPTLSPPEQLDRRTEIPRLRGAMYGPKGKEEDLRTLASWGANLIRWQFYWYHGSLGEAERRDLKAYDAWLTETIAEVDRWLPLCQELGIKVVIDLHTPPGGGQAGQWLMFQERPYQEYFIAAWDRLATHYRDQPAVWGYDLVNEPSEGATGEGLMAWRPLAEHVARRVRAIDPQKAVIVEPGQHGGWSNLPYFPPLDVPGVIYSVHVYDPLEFTHQGILDGYPADVTYPGEIAGKRWDRAAIYDNLRAVREYQEDYNVPIFIGEFSAPRWAPGDSSAAYLRDCIDVFEEFGWDWAYHAFREWHGWNVEIVDGQGEKDPVATEPTGRKKALLEGFAK